MESDFFDLAKKATSFANSKKVQYCDVRAETYSSKLVLIENGEIEHIREESDKGIGIRILNDGAWGFYSITNPKSFEEIKEAVLQTIKNANHFKGKKINQTQLNSVDSHKDIKNFPVIKKPELQDLIEIGLECNKIIFEKPQIKKSAINSWYTINSKYFVNTEGSEIQQNFTDTVIDMSAIAHDSGLTQSVNITEGGRGGIEQITKNNKAQNSASHISQKASELLKAKPAKEEKTTVVMNPDFVSLLTHEILGHPSEADRVLGKEMAWAGGSWWSGKLGEKIGSEHLNVFDDPTIPESLGWYYYDDEGVKTQKNITD